MKVHVKTRYLSIGIPLAIGQLSLLRPLLLQSHRNVSPAGDVAPNEAANCLHCLWTSDKSTNTSAPNLEWNIKVAENFGVVKEQSSTRRDTIYPVDHSAIPSSTAANETTSDHIITRLDLMRDGIDNSTYEEDFVIYVCDDSFQNVTSQYSQGDTLNICAETVSNSPVGINAFKDLKVSQMNTTASPVVPIFEYQYVNDFKHSRLSASQCRYSNTTSAICMTKIQLLSSWFSRKHISDSNNALDIGGIVQLNHLERWYNVDVPFHIRLGEDSLSNDDKRITSNAISRKGSALSFRLSLAMYKNGDTERGIIGSCIASGVTFISSILSSS